MDVDSIIGYWRESLLDAEFSALQLTPDNHILLSADVLRGGALSKATTDKLFARVKRGSQDERVTAMPVVVAPHIVVKERSGSYGRRQVICPLLIPALLNEDGFLEADRLNSKPWIPRLLLEPTGNNLVLGELDALVQYLDGDLLSLPEDPRQSWLSIYRYARVMLETVAGSDWQKNLEASDYWIEEKGALLPLETMRGMSATIVKVYDELRETKSYPTLLNEYVRLQPAAPREPIPEQAWHSPSKRHLGSFNNKFPLSASQRQALNHYLALPSHTVLAISGPPGTGKTTLLHSVIASLWVEAALKGSDPPVIVASSTNNQAVTNVIDSLSSSDSAERWLDVKGFGLYLVNSPEKREAAEGKEIPTVDRRGNGLPDRIEQFEAVDKKVHFLRKCGAYFSKDLSDLGTAILLIQQQMRILAGELHQGIEIAFAAHKLQQEIAALERETGPLKTLPPKLQVQLTQAVDDEAQWKHIERMWNEYLNKESFSEKHLNLIPGVRQKQEKRLSAFRAEHAPWLDDSATKGEISELIERSLATVRDTTMKLRKLQQERLELHAESQSLDARWLMWKKEQKAPELEVDQLLVFETEDGRTNPASLLNWLDTHLRYKLFVLAIHYWEGRWLETIIPTLLKRKNGKESQNRQTQEEKWRRYAMLTPCFVATMHSGPGFFDYYDGQGRPLFDYIDLLIVDEAGQVTPEVSGAMFALAKQALVVGDVQQIEPVWSVPQQVDKGNLQRAGILGEQNGWEALQEKGLTASSGSVMHMAQSVSPFQIPSSNGIQYERGMFLAEHRRCVPEVIEYCNVLAYQGRLRAMRPKLASFPWPHMGYAHVPGVSTKESGSRKNMREAQAVVGWIKENRKALETHYEDQIDGIIGIVTPFAAQKRTLQSLLTAAGISLSKVGTVHALQGGERPLVIFSPVYSKSDPQNYFFDAGPNMLNVAVSRAKDSFVVFGDMRIFDPSLPTPSGLLAHYLFASEDNEIAGYELPSRTANGIDGEEVHLVKTVDRHQRILTRALKKATERLVIVSPYLRWRAVEADGLPEKVASATERGTKVVIYIDDRFNKSLRDSSAAQAAAALRASGAEIKICHNIHSKAICMDNEVFVEGSFNWLSAERIAEEYMRHDLSIIYTGPQACDFIEETVQDMERAVIG